MRDDRLHDVTRPDRWKIVLGVPFLDIGFSHGVQETALESLEHGGAVGEELHADLVDVRLAAHEGHIVAPVVGVALERNVAARVEVRDDIGRG